MLMAGCATTTDVTTESWQSNNSQALKSWRLTGRLALYGPDDSWTASLDWKHQPGDELLKLSGPLGQGVLIITLFGGCITVTQGVDQSESSCRVDELMIKYLGLKVPVSNLGYWVLGQPAPGQPVEQNENGFRQAGWDVSIRKTIQVGSRVLPKKLFISQNQSKLKLVIDQWVLNEP